MMEKGGSSNVRASRDESRKVEIDHVGTPMTPPDASSLLGSVERKDSPIRKLFFGEFTASQTSNENVQLTCFDEEDEYNVILSPGNTAAAIATTGRNRDTAAANLSEQLSATTATVAADGLPSHKKKADKEEVFQVITADTAGAAPDEKIDQLITRPAVYLSPEERETQLMNSTATHFSARALRATSHLTSQKKETTKTPEEVSSLCSANTSRGNCSQQEDEDEEEHVKIVVAAPDWWKKDAELCHGPAFLCSLIRVKPAPEGASSTSSSAEEQRSAAEDAVQERASSSVCRNSSSADKEALKKQTCCTGLSYRQEVLLEERGPGPLLQLTVKRQLLFPSVHAEQDEEKIAGEECNSCAAGAAGLDATSLTVLNICFYGRFEEIPLVDASGFVTSHMTARSSSAAAAISPTSSSFSSAAAAASYPAGGAYPSSLRRRLPFAVACVPLWRIAQTAVQSGRSSEPVVLRLCPSTFASAAAPSSPSPFPFSAQSFITAAPLLPAAAADLASLRSAVEHGFAAAVVADCGDQQPRRHGSSKICQVTFFPALASSRPQEKQSIVLSSQAGGQQQKTLAAPQNRSSSISGSASENPCDKAAAANKPAAGALSSPAGQLAHPPSSAPLQQQQVACQNFRDSAAAQLPSFESPVSREAKHSLEKRACVVPRETCVSSSLTAAAAEGLDCLSPAAAAAANPPCNETAEPAFQSQGHAAAEPARRVAESDPKRPGAAAAARGGCSLSLGSAASAVSFPVVHPHVGTNFDSHLQHEEDACLRGPSNLRPRRGIVASPAARSECTGVPVATTPYLQQSDNDAGHRGAFLDRKKLDVSSPFTGSATALPGASASQHHAATSHGLQLGEQLHVGLQQHQQGKCAPGPQLSQCVSEKYATAAAGAWSSKSAEGVLRHVDGDGRPAAVGGSSHGFAGGGAGLAAFDLSSPAAGSCFTRGNMEAEDIYPEDSVSVKGNSTGTKPRSMVSPATAEGGGTSTARAALLCADAAKKSCLVHFNGGAPAAGGTPASPAAATGLVGTAFQRKDVCFSSCAAGNQLHRQLLGSPSGCSSSCFRSGYNVAVPDEQQMQQQQQQFEEKGSASWCSSREHETASEDACSRTAVGNRSTLTSNIRRLDVLMMQAQLILQRRKQKQLLQQQQQTFQLQQQRLALLQQQQQHAQPQTQNPLQQQLQHAGAVLSQQQQQQSDDLQQQQKLWQASVRRAAGTQYSTFASSTGRPFFASGRDKVPLERAAAAVKTASPFEAGSVDLRPNLVASCLQHTRGGDCSNSSTAVLVAAPQESAAAAKPGAAAGAALLAAEEASVAGAGTGASSATAIAISPFPPAAAVPSLAVEGPPTAGTETAATSPLPVAAAAESFLEISRDASTAPADSFFSAKEPFYVAAQGQKEKRPGNDGEQRAQCVTAGGCLQQRERHILTTTACSTLAGEEAPASGCAAAAAFSRAQLPPALVSLAGEQLRHNSHQQLQQLQQEQQQPQQGQQQPQQGQQQRQHEQLQRQLPSQQLNKQLQRGEECSALRCNSEGWGPAVTCVPMAAANPRAAPEQRTICTDSSSSCCYKEMSGRAAVVSACSRAGADSLEAAGTTERAAAAQTENSSSERELRLLMQQLSVHMQHIEAKLLSTQQHLGSRRSGRGGEDPSSPCNKTRGESAAAARRRRRRNSSTRNTGGTKSNRKPKRTPAAAASCSSWTSDSGDASHYRFRRDSGKSEQKQCSAENMKDRCRRELQQRAMEVAVGRLVKVLRARRKQQRSARLARSSRARLLPPGLLLLLQHRARRQRHLQSWPQAGTQAKCTWLTAAAKLGKVEREKQQACVEKRAVEEQLVKMATEQQRAEARYKQQLATLQENLDKERKKVLEQEQLLTQQQRQWEESKKRALQEQEAQLKELFSQEKERLQQQQQEEVQQHIQTELRSVRERAQQLASAYESLSRKKDVEEELHRQLVDAKDLQLKDVEQQMQKQLQQLQQRVQQQQQQLRQQQKEIEQQQTQTDRWEKEVEQAERREKQHKKELQEQQQQIEALRAQLQHEQQQKVADRQRADSQELLQQLQDAKEENTRLQQTIELLRSEQKQQQEQQEGMSRIPSLSQVTRLRQQLQAAAEERTRLALQQQQQEKEKMQLIDLFAAQGRRVKALEQQLQQVDEQLGGVLLQASSSLPSAVGGSAVSSPDDQQRKQQHLGKYEEAAASALSSARGCISHAENTQGQPHVHRLKQEALLKRDVFQSLQSMRTTLRQLQQQLPLVVGPPQEATAQVREERREDNTCSPQQLREQQKQEQPETQTRQQQIWANRRGRSAELYAPRPLLPQQSTDALRSPTQPCCDAIATLTAHVLLQQHQQQPSVQSNRVLNRVPLRAFSPAPAGPGGAMTARPSSTGARASSFTSGLSAHFTASSAGSPAAGDPARGTPLSVPGGGNAAAAAAVDPSLTAGVARVAPLSLPVAATLPLNTASCAAAATAATMSSARRGSPARGFSSSFKSPRQVHQQQPKQAPMLVARVTPSASAASYSHIDSSLLQQSNNEMLQQSAQQHFAVPGITGRTDAATATAVDAAAAKGAAATAGFPPLYRYCTPTRLRTQRLAVSRALPQRQPPLLDTRQSPVE